MMTMTRWEIQHLTLQAIADAPFSVGRVLLGKKLAIALEERYADRIRSAAAKTAHRNVQEIMCHNVDGARAEWVFQANCGCYADRDCEVCGGVGRTEYGLTTDLMVEALWEEGCDGLDEPPLMAWDDDHGWTVWDEA